MLNNKTIKRLVLIFVIFTMIGYSINLSYKETRDNRPESTVKKIEEKKGMIIFSLTTSWNLISIPYIQSNSSVNYVFSSIQGSYDIIEIYNNTGSAKQWNKYSVDKPKDLNNLETINNCQGVWLHMTKNSTFVFNGSIPSSTIIPLKKGWNLIGYPSLKNRTVAELLNGVPSGTVFEVQKFDKSEPYFLRRMSLNGEVCHMGLGYWIYISCNYNLIVDWL